MSQPLLTLAVRFADAHPADAAQVLESFSVGEIAALLADLPAATAAAVARHMMRSTAAQCLAQLPSHVAERILASVPDDAAAAMLRWLDVAGRDALLSQLPRTTSKRLERLVTFPEGTAGALMTPRVFTVSTRTRIGDLLDRLRTGTPELRYYIYVVDSAQRPVGVLTVRKLLQGPEGSSVTSVMERNVVCLTVSDSVETIRVHPKWADVHALPVVDAQGALVGVMRYETYRRLLRHAQVSPVGTAVDALVSFGELWWQTVAELVEDLTLTVSGPATSPQAPSEPDGRHG